MLYCFESHSYLTGVTIAMPPLALVKHERDIQSVSTDLIILKKNGIVTRCATRTDSKGRLKTPWTRTVLGAKYVEFEKYSTDVNRSQTKDKNWTFSSPCMRYCFIFCISVCFECLPLCMHLGRSTQYFFLYKIVILLKIYSLPLQVCSLLFVPYFRWFRLENT